MEIKDAQFIISNSDVAKCPSPDKPEYAFIGRSNVGKSSLINMLAQRKSLAKTSGNPGKTQLINHFLINKEWYLVDLPGYGYAKPGRNESRKWEKFVRKYILLRQNLYCLFVLVDIRHKPQKIDLEFMEWLGLSHIPFAIIFTKSDKLKPEELEQNINEYEASMLVIWEEMPPWFATSSLKGEGRTEVLQYIAGINKSVGSLNRGKTN
ncbi:MAG TPA: ribosome biogenesis GTP-binding protein YihA/YsxC [Mariniphaga sp.]|nr:ribosome biogenesis GTP-binding protein YihA/YsxC [Mariniphaga sp.]